MLYICQPCLKTHNLCKEKGYAVVRPCEICSICNEDTSEKESFLVKTTKNKIEMNRVRRSQGMVELGEPFEV